MLAAIADNLTLSAGAVAALTIVALIELALAVYCIVDIVRRPAVLGGHKWVWIVIVAVFNLIGSIVYLAVGRAQPPVAETRAEPETTARGKAVVAADLLYGAPAPPGSSEPPTPPGSGETPADAGDGAGPAGGS